MTTLRPLSAISRRVSRLCSALILRARTVSPARCSKRRCTIGPNTRLPKRGRRRLASCALAGSSLPVGRPGCRSVPRLRRRGEVTRTTVHVQQTSTCLARVRTTTSLRIIHTKEDVVLRPQSQPLVRTHVTLSVDGSPTKRQQRLAVDLLRTMMLLPP